MWNRWTPLLALLLAPALGAQGQAQTAPPWSKGANDPATDKGYVFQVPDVDNIPDLHGNPAGADWFCLSAGTSSLCCRS
jgi:hypothetical protein